MPGRPIAAEAVGAVLTRDVTVGGERWPKGRRLSGEDVTRLGDPTTTADLGARGHASGADPGITVLVVEPGDVHEDDAAALLARAVAGPGVQLHGPVESRVDLVASADGVLHVRVAALERLDRVDPLEVFTLYDGQVVRAGDLVGSVKIGPHLVDRTTLERGLAICGRAGPLVTVAPFTPRRVAVVVKESVRPVARERFERGILARVASMGARLLAIRYVEDDRGAVEEALGPLVRGRGRADVVLTAGAASTDPTDPFFLAIGRLGGHIVRHGVPAHPGSMAWLARVGAADVLGLPTCGAYSRATAADLLLPRLLTGERASTRMAASLGHGGVLNRAMRFRFPDWARDLEEPAG